jgi:hypothetical protein
VTHSVARYRGVLLAQKEQITVKRANDHLALSQSSSTRNVQSGSISLEGSPSLGDHISVHIEGIGSLAQHGDGPPGLPYDRRDTTRRARCVRWIDRPWSPGFELPLARLMAGADKWLKRRKTRPE